MPEVINVRIKGLAGAKRTQGFLLSRGCFNISLRETTLLMDGFILKALNFRVIMRVIL